MLQLGKSQYLANVFLNYMFGNITTNPPSNFYLGLFTQISPDDIEVSAPEYARVELPNNAISMPLTVNGEKFLNTTDVSFPEATTAWGTLTHFALFDAPTGGNVYYVGEFDIPFDVNPGNILIIKAGRLKIVESAI